MPFLKQSYNGKTLNVFEFEFRVAIGRGGQCGILLEDPTVSVVHATIEQVDGQYVLIDQDSTNGVIHNGQKVPRLALESATHFTLGTSDFEFLEDLPTDFAKTLKIKKSWIPGVYYT